MKFILGVIVGTALGPRFHKFIDERYGDALVPYLEGVRDRIQQWEPPKETK